MADVTVLIASLPERAEMLAECLASIAAQTVLPTDVFVSVDYERRGPALVHNHLARFVTTDWIMSFGDDDLMDPHHIETVTAYADSHPEVDVISTHCRSTGTGSYGGYNRDFVADHLRRESIVGGYALIRTKLWRKVHGHPNVPGHDWEFWKNCLDAGAHFVTLPETTVTYRFHGKNLSREGVG